MHYYELSNKITVYPDGTIVEYKSSNGIVSNEQAYLLLDLNKDALHCNHYRIQFLEWYKI